MVQTHAHARAAFLAAIALAVLVLIGCPYEGRPPDYDALSAVADTASADDTGDDAGDPDGADDDEGYDPNNPYDRDPVVSASAGKRTRPYKAVWQFLDALEVQSKQKLEACITESSPLRTPPTRELGFDDLALDSTWSAWRCLIGPFEAIHPIYRVSAMPASRAFARLAPPSGANGVVVFTLQNVGPDDEGDPDWRVLTYEHLWGLDKVNAPMVNVETLNDRPIDQFVWKGLPEYQRVEGGPSELRDAGQRLAEVLQRSSESAVAAGIAASAPTMSQLRAFYPEEMHADLTREWQRERRERLQTAAEVWRKALSAGRDDYRHARIESTFVVNRLSDPIAILWLRFTIADTANGDTQRVACRVTLARMEGDWRTLAIDRRMFPWPSPN